MPFDGEMRVHAFPGDYKIQVLCLRVAEQCVGKFCGGGHRSIRRKGKDTPMFGPADSTVVVDPVPVPVGDGNFLHAPKAGVCVEGGGTFLMLLQFLAELPGSLQFTDLLAETFRLFFRCPGQRK